MNNKAIIIDPHYYENAYLGSKRLRYLGEWLNELGFETIIITRKLKKNQNILHNGSVISINDPLNKYQLWISNIKSKRIMHIFHVIFNIFTAIVLIPDKYIFWYREVLKDSKVNDTVKNAKIVLSSNPPESVHLLNYSISKKNKIYSIIDIRDGWNDESLNFYRKLVPFRNSYETFLEKRVYSNAKIIVTNSPGWEKLINKKNFSFSSKISVITNKLDSDLFNYDFSKMYNSDELTIGYAGKFSGSSFRRRPRLIFKPLLESTNDNQYKININLWGKYRKKDLQEINYYKNILIDKKIDVSICGYVDKNTLFNNYLKVDGFLLLSSSIAAIPSKVYEYIYTGKPILAFVRKDSSIHNLLKDIPRIIFYYLDYSDDQKSSINNFFELCVKRLPKYEYPKKFMESELKHKFQKLLNKHLSLNND